MQLIIDVSTELGQSLSTVQAMLVTEFLCPGTRPVMRSEYTPETLLSPHLENSEFRQALPRFPPPGRFPFLLALGGGGGLVFAGRLRALGRDLADSGTSLMSHHVHVSRRQSRHTSPAATGPQMNTG